MSDSLSNRGSFSSSFGFVLAAAGSAVGLGNIWGFPTQAVNNGGGAFLFVYFCLAFLLAYPVLMAELAIGRYAGANVVTALTKLSSRTLQKSLATLTGIASVFTSSIILSFYTIVAGWTVAQFVAALLTPLISESARDLLVSQSQTSNIFFILIFSLITIAVVARGVSGGIERVSKIMMPTLFIALIVLTGYILTLNGALIGLRVYLVPNFHDILNPDIALDALGQAFFSLSLGVGCMITYGSYLNHDENLPRIGAFVTLVDCGVAFLAGLLIIPVLFVASHLGAEILNADGSMIGGPDMVFRVLSPVLNEMGPFGIITAIGFFGLLSIAALTSSISMLEVPVSLVSEKTSLSRMPSAILCGTVIFALSLFISFNMSWAFDLAIAVSTQYSVPIIGAVFCVFVGWLWNRASLLEELRKGNPEIQSSFFWRVWPFYVRYVCPILIMLIFIRTI